MQNYQGLGKRYQPQPRTQDLSLGKTLAAAGHVPHQKFRARGGVGKYQITSTCFQWDIR